MKRKIISVLLCVALVVSVAPVVSAQGYTDNTILIADNDNFAQSITEPYIVGEIIEKRTEDTKHFLMSDRSVMAAMYDEVVHYEDDNGSWVDIDNSFSTNGENEFENKSNSFKTKFSKKSNGNKLVTIKKDNYSLSWMLDDADKVDAQISQSNESASEDISVLKNLQGSVTYPDIQNDVDLQYVVSGNDLKENIIIQSADAPTEYSFTYKFNKLSYRTNDNNQIEFYDESSPENIVFIIDAPYMYDSNRAYSKNIEVQITDKSNGFILKLIPDEEWLLSEDRVYPIVIDPSVLSSQSADEIWDIDLRNTQTEAFSHIAADFLVGSDINGQIYRSLIKFPNLPNIDEGGIVVNAKVHISAYKGPDDTSDPSLRTRPTDDIQVNVHRMDLLWAEDGATWSSCANYYDPIVEDYFTYNDTSEYFSADITKLVNAWYKGEHFNYGIMLKAANESAANHVMQFTSSDWGINDTNSATWRPCLTVNYRVCTGLEDYWSYTTQGMGGYGTGYVNNYNGNLVYIHDDVSFNSLINGFTLSHVYNNVHDVNVTGRYGIGWNLNLVQTFEPVTIKDNDKIKFVYTDGDGTKHYFVELDNGDIVDEDGLGYTYTNITTTGSELTSQLTDKDGNVLKFDQWGALRRIIDTNENTINLNYSPVPNQFNYLSSITTSSGGTIALTYDSEYMLTSITDNAGRVTSFDYHSNNLTKITYPDGTYLEFSYLWEMHEEIGDSCSLTEVTLPNGYQYTYDTVDDKIATSLEKTSSGSQTNELYYTYEHNQTKVEDNHDRYIVYQFDSFGRVTCVYDSDGNSYSETYTQNSDAENKIFSNNKLSLASGNVRYINNLITNPVFSDDLASWTQYKEAPNETQISVVSDQTYISSKTVKITSTASSIQALLQNPTTTAGKTYTLSANIKTENIVSATHGAGVEIVTSSPQGNKYYYSDFILGTTDAEVNDGFVTASVTAAMASDENIVRISVGLYNASGTMWIDSVQLEEGDTANKINLLSNSNFEKNTGSSALPTGYTSNFTAGTAGGSSSADKHSGSYSLKIVGSSAVKRYVYQTLNISGKAGDVYSMGGWAKANAVANHSANGVTDFKFTAGVYYTNGDYVEFPFDLNEYTSEWQYMIGNFVMKEDYNKILIYCSYNFNANTAYFDDMFLYRDIAQSYTYDENGNVISTADYAAQQSAFSYNNDNTISKVLNPDGTGYEYSYSNHLVQTAKSEQGVESKVSRDSYGNATESYVTSSLYTTALTPGKTYRIRNKASGMYITNDTQVARQYAYDLGSNKSWKLEDVGEGYYRLIYVPSPTRCLTLSTTQTNYEYNIEVATLADKGTDAYERQLFKFKVNSEGSYEIIPKTTPKQSLRPLAASTASAAKITCSATNNFDYFCWYFEDASISYTQTLQSGQTYRLRALHSGLCLDVQGSLIKQYVYLQTRQQRFVITEHDGYYTITLANDPNKYLAIDTTQTVSGNPVISVKNSFDNSCKFNITTTGTMGTAIISPQSAPNNSITVSDASLGYSASVVAATDTAGRNQRFVLEPASDIIHSSATYQNNGNYPHTVTDSRGNTTTYTYDTARGLQTGVTDALGNSTTYNYNSLNDRLDSVASGSSAVEYNYNTVGQLTGIESPSGTIYGFVYDGFGNTRTISVGTRTLTTNTYNTSRGLLTASQYGNGQKINYFYDDLDRIKFKVYNNAIKVKFRYDKFGNLYEKQDLFTNTTYRYNYDLTGRIIGVVGSNGTSLNYVYDDFNRTQKYIAKFGDRSNVTEYIYGDSSVSGQKNGLLYGVKQNGTERISYSYDNLARLNTRTLNTTTPFVTQYSYHAGATSGTTTTLIKKVQNGSDSFEYTYDAVGNITEIKKNGSVYESYTYDSLNQLKTVTRGNDIYTYNYDNGGNILSVLLNGTTIKNYTYGDSQWKDMLTAYNGQTITYDTIGNPLHYWDGSNFTWSNGRQLTGITKGTNNISYLYNADGLRASKTVNNMTTEYYWLDGVLLGEKTGSNYITYLYDENGSAYGLMYNNSYLYYSFNAQGDVVALVSNSGSVVARYEYDAWGNILSITNNAGVDISQNLNHIANINPIRYRGYYYDYETGFYLTGTRYYDPEIGRFINADGYVSTGQDVTGYNMFAYCGNNPINRADHTGTFWKEVGNFFKNVGTAIYNGVKKFAKAVVGSFQIEGGVGYGLGASAKIGPIQASLSAYQDGLTLGLKNGSTYTAIKGSAGISAQITKGVNIGLSTEYEHRFETDSIRDWDEHTTMSAPWEVYNCPKTIKEDLSQNLFIGISAELHIGIGGHLTIGWDANEFWRILTE